MHKELRISALYILKIVLGLLWIAGLLMAASQQSQPLYIVLLILLASAIIPILYRAYQGMDELHKSLHQTACMYCLPLLAVLSSVLGVLQAQSVIQTFNAFWILALMIALWGVALMLADRRFRDAS
jgi:hypothetical protein